MGSHFDWNDPVFNSGDFFKFQAKGDEIAGTIEEIGTYKFDDKEDDNGQLKVGATVPTLKLRVAQGQLISLTCSQVDLKNKVVAAKPQIGDSFFATYVDDTKTSFGGKKMMFLVKVTKATAPAADAVDPQEEPNLPF